MNSDPAYPPSSLPANSADSRGSTLAIGQRQWPTALRRQPAWIRYGLLGTAGFLVVLGSAAGYRAVVGSPPDTAPAEGRVLPVETMAVEPVSSYQVPRIYTGEIVALRSSELGFERGGELVEVMAKEGDRVQTGDPIARLDVRNLQTQRLQIEAQKAQAQARLAELQNGARPEDIAAAAAAVRDLEQQLTLRETQARRREYLFERGAIAQEQLDEFTFSAGSLQAQLDQARSRLQELQNGTRTEQVTAQRAVVNQLDAQLQDIDVNLSKSTITAPFDGIVAERKADEGTVLGTGQSVIEVVESAAPEARIGLPASVVDDIQVGNVQTVIVNNQPYQAEVTGILPQVDATTRTQTVVIELDSSAITALEPGQTARLTLSETIQADGFWLPTGALTQGIRGLWTCYVLVPKSEYQKVANAEAFVGESDVVKRERGDRAFVVEQRSVEIIQPESTGEGSTSETRVLVRGILAAGDRVVTSGIQRLVPGQAVRPIAAE
ncbi:MAG: HlyD family efflux transporter periplasmic adaptor subunit [Phormidesmis sp.]